MTPLLDCSRPAEVILALTHMRQSNDERLMREAPEIDLILGGHDHHFEHIAPDGAEQPKILKSGTDFRELSEAVLEVRGIKSDAPGGEESDDSRPTVRVISARRIEVASDAAADEATADLVHSFEALVSQKMEAAIGGAAVALDARFKTIRSEESNISNFVADVLREGTGANLVILNAGTLRADRLLGPGTLTMRDLTSLLPSAFTRR